MTAAPSARRRAAAIYTLIETVNDIDPQAWLADVLPGCLTPRQAH